MREIIPMRRLILEIAMVMNLGGGETTVTNYNVFEENNGALTTYNAVNKTPCTKKIGVKYHLFKNHCGEGSSTSLIKVDTLLQKSEIFTNGMDLQNFKKMRKLVCKW